MEYNPTLDKDARYISIEMNTPRFEFEFKGSLRCPSPSYKIQLSDKELRELALRLLTKWSEALNAETCPILSLAPKTHIETGSEPEGK